VPLEAMMHRSVTVLTLALLICALSATPSTAESAWDPDDVSGPLDVRWVGASFASPTQLNIIVSFYDGFRVEALRTIHFGGQSSAWVYLQDKEESQGVFIRRPGGRIIFVWGNLHNCGGNNFPQLCERGVVTRLSANVLRVVIDPSPVMFDDHPWNIRVATVWRLPDGTGSRERDDTTAIALGYPPEPAYTSSTRVA
jgi:hypothetical protein